MNKFLFSLLYLCTGAQAYYHLLDQPLVRYNSLNTVDGKISVNFLASSAKQSYNETKEKVDLCDIFGKHKLHFLGVDQKRALDTIKPLEGVNTTAGLTVLDALTDDVRDNIITTGINVGTYGQFNITGEVSHKRVSIDLITPSFEGFHLQANIPFGLTRFSEVEFIDLTPETGNGGFNLQRASWTNFRAAFDTILESYKIARTTYSEKGIGDITAGLHYTKEFRPALHAGAHVTALFSTSKEKNEDSLFSLGQGYDGHSAVIVGAKLQGTFYEHFTVQGSFDYTRFNEDQKLIRLKTYEGQQGFLFLTQGLARRKKGGMINANITVSVTPSSDCCSANFGYVYSQGDKTTLMALDEVMFDQNVINTDNRFKEWHRHSLLGSVMFHIKDKRTDEPRIDAGFTFSIPVAGKNIFINKGYGFTAGTTICCEF